MAKTGTYSANLLGTIASNLAGLQGYDVMALELIQNADDAKASSIVFDITDEALIVYNDGEFSYCGALDSSTCPHFSGPEEYACDFHRIVELASGGKAARSENIGRFGIGFVSAYQICDQPQIFSSGVKVTLRPESKEYEFEEIEGFSGSQFLFNWATDPNSYLRQKLGASAIQKGDLDRIESDIAQILDLTLLFLKNLKSAELRRNGVLIRSCKLSRDNEHTILLEFGPEVRLEMWLVIEANATQRAAELAEQFPQLEADSRSSRIAVAFRLDTDPLERGLFYAFLPTEQQTGLPLHINADFYPEPDRKSIILGGGKHQQCWNEMLISVAAAEIAAKLNSLKDQLNARLVWELLQRAWSITVGEPEEWQTYFWAAFEERIGQESELAWSRKKEWSSIGNTILPHKNLSIEEERLINELGVELAAEDIIKPAQQVLNKLGTTILTAKRLAKLVGSSKVFNDVAGRQRVDESLASIYFLPLWALIDRIAEDSPTGLILKVYFKDLPILLTSDNRPVAPADAHEKVGEIFPPLAELIPELNMISKEIYQYPVTKNLVPNLTLRSVVDCLSDLFTSPEEVEGRLGPGYRNTHTLHRAMADIAASSPYQVDPEPIRKLPIFLTGRGYKTAETVCLAGDFTDPIGFANILESRALDQVIEGFFRKSLGIEKLDIGTYVTQILPGFFAGETDSNVVNSLLGELANHRAILDDDDLLDALSELPLIPTQDGGSTPPRKTYFRTDELAAVLGDNRKYWVDENRLDSSRSIRIFVEQLGLLARPSGEHLADRILGITAKTPNEAAQQACEKAFYEACEQFDDWKRTESAELTIFVNKLVGKECLPAHHDNENWHCPEDLYAPYRLEAFSSQAAILPFRNLRKLSADLLKELGIKNDPETELVVAHLQQCIETVTKPAKTVYQILNERTLKEEESLKIKVLASQPCIYDESRETFLRPNQLFWTAPNLGSRALKVPTTLTEYRRLFDLLGVKDAPTPMDHLAIAMDIIKELGDTGRALTDQDRHVYQRCLETSSTAIGHGDDELELAIRDMRDHSCILNLDGRLCFPDEIAIRDSDWHESFFGDELRGMLTAFQPELQPLYRVVGLQFLSQKIHPVIGQKLGDRPMTDLAERLRQRADCILRVLHDRPRNTLIDLHERLSTISVILCDTLDIQFICELQSPPLESPETPEKAHYEKSENTLYVSTSDISEFAIPAFNSLLHILATSPTGASIPNLVLVCELILDASDLAAAERKLSAAGFPDVINLEADDDEELDGGELGDLGTGKIDDESPVTTNDEESDEESAGKDLLKKPKPTNEEPDGTRSQSNESGSNGDETTGTGTGDSGEPKDKSKKERGKKRQDRLLSYVIPKGEETSTHTSDPSIREHNLTVENKGRAAVVLYEKERGRDAIPQSQENPGWDIVSTDIASGSVRYIEVKAINGEWGKTGVGLSRLQFSEAQDHRENYWLYVVENAGDREHERVHPIQSPASKVTSFMFDHNWRDAVTIEEEKPHAPYQPGVKVDCGMLGRGVIKEVITRGRSIALIIDFGKQGTKALNLNVSTIKIVEDPEE